MTEGQTIFLMIMSVIVIIFSLWDVVRTRRKNVRLEDLLDEQARRIFTWYICPQCGNLAKAAAFSASVPVRSGCCDRCGRVTTESEIDEVDPAVIHAALKEQRQVVLDHNARVENLPKLDPPPTTAAEGLRHLVRWFDALFEETPGDRNRSLQDDLNKWADQWEDIEAELAELKAQAAGVMEEAKDITKTTTAFCMERSDL